jgi:hypothetical protein
MFRGNQFAMTPARGVKHGRGDLGQGLDPLSVADVIEDQKNLPGIQNLIETGGGERTYRPS